MSRTNWRRIRTHRRLIEVSLLWGGLILFLVVASSGTTGRGDHAFSGPSSAHWLGCGQIGEDLAAYLLDATARSVFASLVVSIPAVAIAYLVGGLWALGRQGALGTRVLILTFLGPNPLLLTLSILSCFSEPDSLLAISIAMVAVAWPPLALRIRNEMIRLLEEPWIVRAEAEGASTADLLLKELLPMAAPILGSMLVLAAIFAVGTEATLGFLGGTSGHRSLGKLLEISRDAFENGEPRVVHGLRLIGSVAVVLGVLVGGLKLLQCWRSDVRVARGLADIVDGDASPPEPAGPAYRVNVWHRGSGLPLVRDAVVTVRPGAITVLCGSSGGGKTLTAQAVAGLIPPGLARSVQPLGDVPVGGVALLSQGLQELFGDYLTIGDYLDYARVIDADLAAVGLDRDSLQVDGQWKSGKSLSGGMSVRVALELVLSTRRFGILILDEPTGPLDQENSRLVGEALRRLVRDRPDVAVLVINHRHRFNREFADDLVFLVGGTTAWLGRASDFFATCPGQAVHPAIDLYLRTIEQFDNATGEAEAYPLGLLEDVVIVEDLALRHLAGGSPIVEGVSFRAGPGRAVVLDWPNGVGKSSVLGAIEGSLLPVAGSIQVAGLTPDLTSSEYRRLVRSCGQNPALLLNPEVPVRMILRRQAVRLGLADGRGEVDTLIKEACEKARFPTRSLDKRPVELSGGLRARAGLARCLLGEVRVLLVDEPSANLDPETALDVMERLGELVRLHGLTLILAAHDDGFVRALGVPVIRVPRPTGTLP